MKYTIYAVIFFVCAGLLLTGCWDYRGMDEINIVAGVAVDKSDDGYALTLELVNVSGLKEGDGAESLIVTAEGPTLFEAVRNSKKKLYNKLYFGSMRTLIISQELAGNEGIMGVVDGFLRDVEPRETISLVISQEDSAGRLLAAKGLDTTNVSYEIAKIIEEDHKIDSTSRSVQLFEAYNYIHAKGLEMVLPAFHLVENQDEEVVEINGVATFRGDKLVGFLSPEETHYYLMATDHATGGALSIDHPERENETVSFEIMNCTNAPDVCYVDGKVTIRVKVNMDCKVVEYPNQRSITNEELEVLRRELECAVQDRITGVFLETQKEPGIDIYGFGNLVFEDQYDLWRDIEAEWPELYQNADFQAMVNITILDIGITS